MVDWVPIGGVGVMCEGGLLLTMMHVVYHILSNSSVSYSDKWNPSMSEWSYYWSV